MSCGYPIETSINIGSQKYWKWVYFKVYGLALIHFHCNCLTVKLNPTMILLKQGWTSVNNCLPLRHKWCPFKLNTEYSLKMLNEYAATPNIAYLWLLFLHQMRSKGFLGKSRNYKNVAINLKTISWAAFLENASQFLFRWNYSLMNPPMNWKSI